ncbi:MAG: 8-oxo-dGTP diphosphatase [Clostridia bacterium]|nr:8-oxo-dGTP diphosphatase [Clostridia bacterium]
MAKKETCILTNMCMISDGERILVQDRRDPNWPGITFPGGHVELGESFVESAIREVKEETGLTVSDLRLCGVKQWTQRGGEYRYIVFFYKTETFSGKLKSSDEGDVFWISKDELQNYALADGFLRMYEVFEQDGLSENYHWFEKDCWRQKNL